MRLIPPAWTLGIAVVQRQLVRVTGGRRDYRGRRALAIGLGLGAAALYGAVGTQFGAAGTTIDPRTPHRTTSLVTSGVFAHSRNPIYVADALILAAYAAWLGRPVALLGIPALAAALHPQILAEEAALGHRFGSEYEAYLTRVPRWVGPRA
ncbi:MAG TPA: isoprenylcysteine carboxylmethyltransferase family protein [Propionibacteriaceae bacterium]|nr:isoprenylcysteine carboxylmethyltransferase family protein [Propionibacteriaceae bacterium]